MRVKALLDEATQQLNACTDAPHLEAEILLAHVLIKPRSYLLAHPEFEPTPQAIAEFNAYLQRRLANEPIAYITGKREFWSLEFAVSRDTLIPRPETELLITTVLAFATATSLRLLDLGTGSGAIAIALASERPQWEVSATDLSESALSVAALNAAQHGAKNITFYQSNWFAALPLPRNEQEAFDIIVSNPPYLAESEWDTFASGLEFEPRAALVSGPDGLEAIRAICARAPAYLKREGYLIIEHGYLQAAKVRALFTKAGFKAVESMKDLAGHERITGGRLAP